MFGIIMGSIYGVSVLATAASFAGHVLKIKNKIKKEGYIIKKGKTSSIFLDDKSDFAVLLFIILFPGFNTMMAFASPILLTKEFDEDYRNYKQHLINNYLLKKSEERLEYEENYIIKQEKFEEARKSFHEEKMANFETLNDVDKLKVLKEEREKVYNNSSDDELRNAYNQLTKEEKIEFLDILREEVLSTYNIEYKTPKHLKNKLLRK
ncbi:MAG: hypothetical protein ACI4OT_00870 [Bacilli bacterium]